MAAADQEHLGIPQVLQQVQRDLQVEGHRGGRGEEARDGNPSQVDDPVPAPGEVRHGGGILQIHDQGLDSLGQIDAHTLVQGHHMIAPAKQSLGHVAADEA